MAKQKQTAEQKNVEEQTISKADVAQVEVDGTPATEGSGKVEGKPAKEKKAASMYEVVSLPGNRDRLSPQLRALVDAVDECTQEVDGKKLVSRPILLAKWMSKVSSDASDKVFASYMHQLLSFAFLDRVGSSATPKKVISPMERKQKLMDMLSKLPEEDRKELLAKLMGGNAPE